MLGLRLTAHELVVVIRKMLLVREGETITPAVADERARNIAAVLMGARIEE